MQRFFINSRDIEQNDIMLFGNNAKHIALSLRMATGKSIVVCDGCGNDCLCEITRITPECVCARVCERVRNSAEPPYRAVLYQALAKGEKMDYIIQKAVELGVGALVPFESSRCIVRLRGDDAAKKQARWQRIAEEAAKQSGRGIIPQVALPVSYEQALASRRDGQSFICYECEENTTLADIPRSGEYHFFIGPEGGFSPGEAEAAADAGLRAVSLGRRILRCESASGFVLSCLSYISELSR